MGICVAIVGSQGAGFLTLAIGIAWVLFSLWVWPDTLVFDEQGLAAIHIWRPVRRMAYAEIDHVARMADKSAIVYGSGAVKEISISEYHARDDELEAELKERGIKYYGKAPSSAKLEG